MASKASVALNKLCCWLAKQGNATSLALPNLLMDVDSVRQATSQNHAAIDFLLLAHSHGCEEFDGMCCVNFSDHSVSIHESIQKLRDKVGKHRQDDEWGWLNNFPGGFGLGSWVMHLLKLLTVCLLIFSCILIRVPESYRPLYLGYIKKHTRLIKFHFDPAHQSPCLSTCHNCPLPRLAGAYRGW